MNLYPVEIILKIQIILSRGSTTPNISFNVSLPVSSIILPIKIKKNSYIFLL